MTRLDDPSLRLPRPAVRGLAASGATTLEAAWAMSDEDMLALHGVGPKAVRMIRALEGGPSPMDEYLDGLPRDQRAALERVRATVVRVAPEAEAGTSYGMPAFLVGGRPLLGFRAAKRHLSVFRSAPPRSRPSRTGSRASTSPRARSGSRPTGRCRTTS